MKAGTRLALYALGLVVAFVAAFGIARAVIPDGAVEDWERRASAHDHGAAEAGAHDGHAPAGLSLESDGLLLSPILAPTAPGVDGALTFQIRDDSGAPVADYTPTHEKDLHLIVVRTDGAHFRHVHPTLDEATGTWSVPWRWETAGTYRVYTDFTPAGDDAEGVTLSRLVDVGGPVELARTEPTRTARVGGYTVTLAGDLVPGSSNTVTASVTRDGRPVTALQPYLGAFGHLVALREGDLAYLHVHPEGAAPKPGETSGPDIAFAATPSTPGRYLLYLDFQVDGTVHAAAFAVDAAPPHDAHDHAH
ncbi:MAG: heavy-metal-associated domain-containing protein [Gordonia sp. (in: high G+C Gram-positive bacteria)]|uniref:heavy-metal-associated domain-containing protein n=1 Tax=Gordonia sp. (in: high G+C Gram-positive bacteria) TaxID=84139 RepID=UPI0039E4A0B7